MEGQRRRNEKTARAIVDWRRVYNAASARYNGNLLDAVIEQAGLTKAPKLNWNDRASFAKTFTRFRRQLPQEKLWVLRIHEVLQPYIEPGECVTWDWLLKLAQDYNFSGKATAAVKLILKDWGVDIDVSPDASTVASEPAFGPAADSAEPQMDQVLREYLRALTNRLDFVEAPGEWSEAGRDPSEWPLTTLYWRVPVLFDRMGAASPAEEPAASQPPPDERINVRALISGVGSGVEDRFGAALAHRRIAVVGEQGVGKGCLLRHTAIAYGLRMLGDGLWAKMRVVNDLPDRPMLPVFIDVRDTKLDGADCVDWSLLVRDAVGYLGAELRAPADSVVETIAEWVRQDRETLLIVDGLDEAPSDGCVRQIDDLAGRMLRHPRVRLVRSARWSRGRLKPIENVSCEVQLRRLEMGDRREFLRHLLDMAQVPDPEGWATRALEIIDRLVGAPRMSRTPLFLTLLASNLLRLEAWRDDGSQVYEALLQAMFQRSKKGRRIADCPGWFMPAGQLALTMSIRDEQQVEDRDLHEQVNQAFATMPGLPIAQRVTPDDYVQAMIASGLLRERRHSHGPFGRLYDFGLEELRSWLAMTMLQDRIARSPQGSSSEAWITGINRLGWAEDFRIPYARHDFTRQVLLVAPEGVAKDYLDLAVRADAEENLSFVIGSMAAGLAPHKHAAWRLTELVLDKVGEGRDRKDIADLWSRLGREADPPHAAPRAWARMIGLYAAAIPGVRELELTQLHGTAWLEDMQLIDHLRKRLNDERLTEACAAAYELIDWGFRLPPTLLKPAQITSLRSLVDLLMTIVEAPDVRAEFAIWALRWIAQNAPFTRSNLDVHDRIDLDRVAAAALRRDLGDIGAQNAASLLCLDIASREDRFLDWASALEAGAAVGSIQQPASERIDEPVLMTLRAMRDHDRSPFAKGRIAAASVIAGGDDPEEIETAIKHVAEHESPTPLLNALASRPYTSWLPHLHPLFRAKSPDSRLRAVVFTLAFAPSAGVEKVLRSQPARNWLADVREDLARFLQRGPSR